MQPCIRLTGLISSTVFLKYKSIRSACAEIVKVMKDEGIFQEAENTGKDFTEYSEKFNLNEKDKKNLAEILLIIYAITTETVSEGATNITPGLETRTYKTL